MFLGPRGGVGATSGRELGPGKSQWSHHIHRLWGSSNVRLSCFTAGNCEYPNMKWSFLRGSVFQMCCSSSFPGCWSISVLALQVSAAYGLMYVFSKYGHMYICDIESAVCLISTQICTSIIFRTTLNTNTQGVIAVNRAGQVLTPECYFPQEKRPLQQLERPVWVTLPSSLSSLSLFPPPPTQKYCSPFNQIVLIRWPRDADKGPCFVSPFGPVGDFEMVFKF